MPKELRTATPEQVVQIRNSLNLSQHERDYITELCSPTNILQISSEEINCLHLPTTHHWKNRHYFQLNFGNTK